MIASIHARSSAAGGHADRRSIRSPTKSIRNPLAVGGGSDPDPPDQIRCWRSALVLTGIRVKDIAEIIAAGAQVARARAWLGLDANLQRTAVTITPVTTGGGRFRAPRWRRRRSQRLVRVMAWQFRCAEPYYRRRSAARRRRRYHGATAALIDPSNLIGNSIGIGKSSTHSDLRRPMPGVLRPFLQFDLPRTFVLDPMSATIPAPAFQLFSPPTRRWQREVADASPDRARLGI